MAVQERFSIPIPSEKMLVELAAMPNSIQFAALSYPLPRVSVLSLEALRESDFDIAG